MPEESTTGDDSTTPDPAELTRELCEAPSGDATMRFYAAGAVYDMSRTGLGVFAGAAAIRGFLEDWDGDYDEYEEELLEIRHLGHGVVFASVRHEARLPGAPADSRVRGLYAYVFVWRDGKVTRTTLYTDTDEARAAAEALAESRE